MEAELLRARRTAVAHGKTKLKPGPRKNEPIITSTAQNIRCTVMSEIANLRSSGLFDGLRSMIRGEDQTIRADAGMVTPATIGWNIVSSSCRPRKYHGAFDGFGVCVRVGELSNGALTKIEKQERERRAGQGGHELGGEQVRPGVDLVDGWALTSWIDPDLTTVSSRWV